MRAAVLMAGISLTALTASAAELAGKDELELAWKRFSSHLDTLSERTLAVTDATSFAQLLRALNQETVVVVQAIGDFSRKNPGVFKQHEAPPELKEFFAQVDAVGVRMEKIQAAFETLLRKYGSDLAVRKEIDSLMKAYKALFEMSRE